MNFEMDLYNLSFYLLKKVVVTFLDGSCVNGCLKNVLPASQEIQLDDAVYPIASVADMEMIGNLAYHTYATEPQRACDIDGLYFGMDVLVPDTDLSLLLYGEFDCVAACHLIFADSKLSVKDVRILSASHKVIPSVLSKVSYMYVLRDGGILVGTLENEVVRTADGQAVPVSMENVQDIIRLPLTNDSVEITLKNGSVLSGVVSAANEAMVVVIGETVQPVLLTDIAVLRYKGVLSTGTMKLSTGTVRQIRISLGVKDEAFLCKLPYFHSREDEENAFDGALASFIPGVTDRGLIAKDVVIEYSKQEIAAEEPFETGIIVIAPTASRPFGYIGQEFVTKTYSLMTKAGTPRGTVNFSADQLTFRLNPRNVYVVKYQSSQAENTIKARNIQMVESYPVSDYARIWIDEEGVVQKMPVSVLFLDKFLNHKVDIETNGDQRICGTLTQVKTGEIVVESNGESTAVKNKDILSVFYYGTVSAYQPNNGTGFINGQYWFHVNSFADMNQILSLEVGSSVRFTFEVSMKGNMCAAKSIQILENNEKIGYMIKYVPKQMGRGFGFIIPPELLEDRLKRNDKSGTHYFKESEIENPGSFKIDTNRAYYSVTYTEGEANTAYNVKILEEYVIAPVVAPAPAPVVAPKSVAAPAPAVVTPAPAAPVVAAPTPVAVPAAERRREVVKISEMVAPTSAYGDAEYVYGLINIYSSHYALINPQFLNRTYLPDELYDMSKSVYFNPEETNVQPDAKLKTAKFAYLVRYVKNGTIINPSTGDEQDALDSNYPVEVVHSFVKKHYVSLVVTGDTLTIEYADVTPVAQPEPPKFTVGTDDAPELMLGESVYFKFKDSTACHGIYSGENDKMYMLSDGKNIAKESIDRFFRFGVITALNIEEGTATINNSFDFSLSVAEPKMVSILKNQKNLVRLHIMYSCVDGKITEVCRVSKRCLTCLIWDAGIVTDVDSKAQNILIDSSITHYLTVMSDGVNVYVNNRSILNRAVFVKQVFHPYQSNADAELEIVSMAVDVRCQEEELKIQYDDGKDIYFGYRNATVSFPVFGNSKALQEKIGETIIVAFRVGADQSSLEGYIEEDTDELEENAELQDDHGVVRVQNEALSLLLLQREDVEQALKGKVQFDADGKLNDQEQLKRAVDMLIGAAKPLAAIKLSLEYPEHRVIKYRESSLRSAIQEKSTEVGLDANSYYGEQAFYLATVLQYPPSSKAKNRYAGSKASNTKYSKYDFLYRLFAQDFESREHLVKYLQSGKLATIADLTALFGKPCMQVGELIAHIVLLDKLNLDTVCSLLRGNKQLSDKIIAYAKEIDDMIVDQDLAAVIRAIQDRYLRDKRRFSDRMIALIDKENICDELKKLIGNMQSRFLRLMCKDDCQRFERLLKICTDVLDYINKPGFTQQEQLLQHAYRELGMLEEDILTHPCKESVEILLSSGNFDLTSNVLVSVKSEIYGLLNRLYQEASKPRVHCRVNESAVLPGAKTFWLIVENGGQNENLQPAENLCIELESFTLGFMPQAKVHLPQNKLSCGDQLAVEVEFELSADAVGVLEFGWTASYEFTTEFQSNGSIARAVFEQESEHPIQLQVGADMAHNKDYRAENPYLKPASGQPLVGKEMFFGRETEKRKILECICTEDGEKNFIPGSAVIIHGQKKSGKTSLVNQVKNYIKEDADLSSKAIFLNFSNILDETGGVELLHCFKHTFYAVIMSRFEDEICENHPDVAEKMDEIGLMVPDLLAPESQSIWSVQFDKFFRDFAKMDNGQHNIILFMDEFTLLCTTILSEVQLFPERASLNNIPNFIKTFSQYGFIQIIIGHEAMMRALGTLGVLNHTAEFAKSIEISALDDMASRALVTWPMRDKFGFDVYGSELGIQAVDRLLDLSGRNPAYLMRLCNQMFMYYTDPVKCPRTQLLISDVNAMVQEYTGELLLSDFDILLMEDGDDAVEAEKRMTYHYLKCAALLSLSSYDKRTADSSEITRGLIRDYGYAIAEIEKTRNILEARRVISITNGGRVKINTGLFSEYIQQKNGL